MEKIVETIPSDRVKGYDVVSAYFGDKKVCMFDIETTGLSPHSSFTYLIGINVLVDGEWQIIQLFNDDGKSEPEMIRCFQEMLPDFDVLVEFNGDNFDIPFIEKRMNQIEQKFGISLTNNFRKIKSFDLMKLIRPYKFALGLPNIKQKTIEKYLGINRLDMYNGGQLIDVYLGFIAMQDEKSRRLVLQHNRDDMEGMIFLSNILSIEAMAEGRFEVGQVATDYRAGKLYMIVPIQLETSLKTKVYTSTNGLSLTAEGVTAELKIPIYEGKLKYFLGNSVKDGCETYEGYFVPSVTGSVQGVAEYKEQLRGKDCYIMLDDYFLSNNDYIKQYTKSMVKLILLSK